MCWFYVGWNNVKNLTLKFGCFYVRWNNVKNLTLKFGCFYVRWNNVKNLTLKFGWFYVEWNNVRNLTLKFDWFYVGRYNVRILLLDQRWFLVGCFNVGKYPLNKRWNQVADRPTKIQPKVNVESTLGAHWDYFQYMFSDLHAFVFFAVCATMCYDCFVLIGISWWLFQRNIVWLVAVCRTLCLRERG